MFDDFATTYTYTDKDLVIAWSVPYRIFLLLDWTASHADDGVYIHDMVRTLDKIQHAALMITHFSTRLHGIRYHAIKCCNPSRTAFL